MATADKYLLEIALKDGATLQMRRLAKEGKKAGQQVAGGQRRMQRELSRTTRKTQQLRSSFSSFRGQLLGALGIGGGLYIAVNVLRSATTRFAEFERQMLLTAGVAGASKAQFDAMRGSAELLGATLQFTATQVGSLQQRLAQAGLSATEILLAQKPILNASIATGTDLNTTANLLTATMRSMGISATFAGETMDKLVATATSSNTTLTSLSDSMNYAGATAKALGIPLNQVLGYIAAMGDAGLRGSLATRAFSTSLARLTKPTAQMQKVMRALNISFFDQRGQMKDLVGVVAELEKKTAGLTNQQKQSALATIFGAESIQEINILMAKGSDHLRRYADGLSEAQGKAQELAGSIEGSMFDATKKLESAWDGLLIKMGDSSWVKGFKKGLASTINDVTNTVFSPTQAADLVKAAQDTKAKANKISAAVSGDDLSDVLARNYVMSLASLVGKPSLLAPDDDREALKNRAAELAKVAADEFRKAQLQKSLSVFKRSLISEKRDLLEATEYHMKENPDASIALRSSMIRRVERLGEVVDRAKKDIARMERELESFNQKSPATDASRASGELGLGSPKSPEGQAVLESMKATVTGGRRNNVVNVQVGNGVNIEQLDNHTGEGAEEVADKVAEVVTRAINDGARQGATMGGN